MRSHNRTPKCKVNLALVARVLPLIHSQPEYFSLHLAHAEAAANATHQAAQADKELGSIHLPKWLSIVIYLLCLLRYPMVLL